MTTLKDVQKDKLKQTALYLDEISDVESEEFWRLFIDELPQKIYTEDQIETFAAEGHTTTGSPSFKLLCDLRDRGLAFKTFIKCLETIKCTKAFNLFIQRTIPVILEHPSSQLLQCGDVLVLRCRGDCVPSPPQYQWYWNDTPLLHQTDSVLKISDVNTSHTGDYKCVVTNPYINDDVLNCSVISYTVKVEVLKYPILESNAEPYLYPESFQYEDESRISSGSTDSVTPRHALCEANKDIEIIVQPLHLECRYNETFQFECIAKSQSGKAITYKWIRKKPGRSVILHSEESVNKSVLSYSWRKHDILIFYCVVSTDGFVTEVVSDEAKVTVHSIWFEHQPKPVYGYIGQYALLHCEAVGKGPITYLWLKKEGDRNVKVDQTSMEYGVLEFPSLQVTHWGQYICQAQNEEEFVTSNVVTVECQLPNKEKNLRIVTQPKSYVFVRNDSITLTCEAVSMTEINYQWYHDDKELRNETLDTLILSSINDLQFGSYHCVVTSGDESVTSDKATVVYGLPIGSSKMINETQTDQCNDTDIKKLRRVICSVLAQHHTSLHDSSRNILQLLANQMYSAGLISIAAVRSHSFDSVLGEFIAALNLKRSVSKIEQHCSIFLSILTNIGGPCAQGSQVLQQDWIKESRTECGVDLQLGPLQDNEKELEFALVKKKDYSELLDKARKEGYVTIKWTKLFVSGPPGSGKSCIIKLLLNEDPPDCHHSTPVVTVPEVRMVTTTPLVVGEATQSFIKVDIDSLKEMLAEAIKKGVKPRSLSTVQSDKDDGSDHSSSDEAHDLEQQASVKTVSQPQQLLSSPVSNATKEILERLPDVKESLPLFESHWIYAVDSGGQAAFLDMAPGLLRYNSVNILTHKLNEKLEDVSKFYFSINGEVIGNPVKRQITNLQLIEASFRSLTSVNPPNLPGIPCSVKDLEPVCLVLGTFYDKISDSGESLAEKNNKLYSTLKQYGDALILHHIRGKEVIFPVNTIAKDMNRQIIAKEIRHEICQSYTKAEIPVRWFLFQLDLEQHQMTSNSSIVSKSECINIGSTLEMDEGDVNAALMYYHDLTIYLYFPEVLPNVVFVNPKPLLDKLSLLISISFTDAVDDLKRTLGIRVHDSTHEKLKIQGIFSRNLLTESLSQGFSKEFSADDFLKLMEYLFIVSPLPQRGEYFLPCVLPTTTDLESLRASFKDKVDPLILTWNEKPLPQGLFPALIVSLLSRNCSPKFYLSTPRSDDLQFRNAICLECRSFAGAILLVDGTYWLELFYTGPPNKCYHIYEAVKEGIKAVVNKFHYMHSLEEPEERFHCPFCKQPEHFCHLNEDKTKLTCFINYSPVDKKRQLPWFTPEVKASFAHEIHEESEGDIVTMTTSHTKLDNTSLNCDMAKKVLIRSTDIIVESGIDPVVLARKLYAKEIMSDNVYDRVKDKATRDSNEDRLEAILSDLRSRVKNDASILMTFVDILKVDLKRQDLADKIMSKLS